METPLDPLACGLPHREPFLFLDAIVARVPGELARGHKTFLAQEPFFAGHFPGDPLVPGVILTEALAQISGVVLGVPGLRLAAIRSMKFLRPVRPGERLELAARYSGEAGKLILFEARASVGEETAAEGTLVLARP